LIGDLKMAKAKVELIEGASYNGRARAFFPGKPHIITSESEIAFYKARSAFRVTMLEEDKPAAPVKAAKPVKAKAVETTEAEDDEEEAEEDSDKDGPPSYSKADLEKMKKPDLVEIATGLAVDFGGPDATKPKIIAAILKFQIAEAKDDEEESDEDEEEDED
jgi:hypothetical protein